MIDIVKKTIDFYIKNRKKPLLGDLGIDLNKKINKKASLFITLYYKGEIRGSAGNIKELKDLVEEEIIENSIEAINFDKRFIPLSIGEAKDIKVRIDTIVSRRVLGPAEINSLEPIKSGVIAIKKDYSKMAVVLPNISPNILMGIDFKKILGFKLQEDFDEENYIVYEIKTEVEKDF